MGYIPGYLATIIVDGTPHHPDTSQATLNLTRDVMAKPKLGARRIGKLAGLGDGTLDMTLHQNTDTAMALMDAYLAMDPVQFTWRTGALGDTDSGQIDGYCLVSDYGQGGDADGEWDVTINLELTGDINITPPI